jgi:hypothetical protein
MSKKYREMIDTSECVASNDVELTAILKDGIWGFEVEGCFVFSSESHGEPLERKRDVIAAITEEVFGWIREDIYSALYDVVEEALRSISEEFDDDCANELPE